MAWQNFGSSELWYSGMLLGYAYFQYDDSSTTWDRPIRLFVQVAKQGYSIDATFRDVTINGVNYGNVYVQIGQSGRPSSMVVWSGSAASNTNCTATWYIRWLDGVRYYSIGNSPLPPSATPPYSITGSLGDSDQEGVAIATIEVGGWGQNSSQGQWAVNKNNTSDNAWAKSSESNIVEWQPTKSTNSSATAVSTWYPAAINNNGLEGFGNISYLASPSAPIIKNFLTGPSLDASLNIKASINYRGGLANGSNIDSANMGVWRLYLYKEGEQKGEPYYEEPAESSNEKEYVFWPIERSNLDRDTNYYATVSATNIYGASSESTVLMVAPSNIFLAGDNSVAQQMTVTVTTNNAGGINNDAILSNYTFSYSLDQVTWTAFGTPRQFENTATATGLLPNTTYYFRVAVYNNYGLSTMSTPVSFRTKERFEPEAGEVTFTPTELGLDVSVKIEHTGGVQQDEEVVTDISLLYKPKNSNEWALLQEESGLSLHAGDTYDFTSVLTGDMPEEGDYDFKVVLSNGLDTGESQIYTLVAPLSVSISESSVAENCPIQVKIVGKATGDIVRWKLKNLTNNTEKNVTSSELTQTVYSNNHLEYNSIYKFVARVYNQYGLWRQSPVVSVRTNKRAYWYFLNETVLNNVDSQFFKPQSSTARYDIGEYYYVVKNALGNLRIGSSLHNKRLEFISQPLFYRPENVISLSLSNGKSIAYKYNPSTDMYVFGIWDGETLETTFFDGLEWQMSHYNITEDIYITNIIYGEEH